MSFAFGIKALQPVAGQPHVLGFAAAESTSDQEIVEVWNGPTSAARVFRMNKDGQVQAANGTVSLPAYSFESDKDSGVYRIGANNVGVAVNGAKVLDVGTGGLGVTGTLSATGASTLSGTVYIGDSANADVTRGLTINQGANDDQIIALKSSDVAHGLTSQAETDTFGFIKKGDATRGGVEIVSIHTDSTFSNAMRVASYGGQADTTKSTAGRALVEIYVSEHDGANALANVTADGNVFGVLARVGGSDVMRWMVDEDGDTWQAGSLTTVGAVLPNANDGAALGASGTAWSDLFLASGAVINFAAGDVTLTHGAGYLSMSADKLFVGDTANANVTVGLTINQGAADDEILSLKSSDVAHGLADSETDTYLSIKKANAESGGVWLSALAEDGAHPINLAIYSVGGTASTAKTIAGTGLVQIRVAENDGAGAYANITADGNVLAVVGQVGGGARTLFIIDEDGDFLYDGADGGAFDAEDDIALVRAFALATSKDVIRSEFDDFVRYNEDDLVRLGILGAPVRDGGLVNGAQLQRLIVGAVWQQAQQIEALRSEVKALSA